MPGKTKKFKFDLTDTGQGTPVLMFPGSYATPAAWKGVQGAVTTPCRFLSTSLPGYGTTPEVRPNGDDDMGWLIEFIGQVVDAIGEPVHVVGHSWGATLALAAIFSGRIKPLSYISFEANPLFADPPGGSFSWRPQIRTMVSRFRAALEAGDPDAAAIIIDFYSRPGVFGEMPDNVRAFCQASAPTNLRDWSSVASFTPAFNEFAEINIPVTLARGENTPGPIVELTDHLANHLPGAHEQVVMGADHFLISTHPEICAEIIDEHFRTIRR